MRTYLTLIIFSTPYFLQTCPAIAMKFSEEFVGLRSGTVGVSLLSGVSSGSGAYTVGSFQASVPGPGFQGPQRNGTIADVEHVELFVRREC